MSGMYEERHDRSYKRHKLIRGQRLATVGVLATFGGLAVTGTALACESGGYGGGGGQTSYHSGGYGYGGGGYGGGGFGGGGFGGSGFGGGGYGGGGTNNGQPVHYGGSGDGSSTTSPANISINSSSSTTQITVGSPITYTINVTNIGGSDSGNITITDTFPTNVTINNISAPGGTCSQTGQTVTCSFTNLAPGAKATITIVVTPTSAGSVTPVTSGSSGSTGATVNVAVTNTNTNTNNNTVVVTPAGSTSTTTPGASSSGQAAAAVQPKSTKHVKKHAKKHVKKHVKKHATKHVAKHVKKHRKVANVKIAAIKVNPNSVKWCKTCKYPNAKMTFNLSRRAQVRLDLMTNLHGKWQSVVTTMLKGKKGHNTFLVAGRWHNQLVPGRKTAIDVSVRHNGHWKMMKSLKLDVISPYTTKVLNG